MTVNFILGKFMNVKSVCFKSLSRSALPTGFFAAVFSAFVVAALTSNAAQAFDACPNYTDVTYNASDKTLVSNDGAWIYHHPDNDPAAIILTSQLSVAIDSTNTVTCQYRAKLDTRFSTPFLIDMVLLFPGHAVPITNGNWTTPSVPTQCSIASSAADCPFYVTYPTTQVNVNPFGREK